eukprot:TRINITY_DN999_c0_g1_i1.p1 TRINITY_DN999_c0_g1~~TRINITY_DN999_c0_g1_i1.p1  ORF type:complete len:254 (-),score=61.56 TRINITY_DN999_c0_g1_i1:267-1028(-)
MAPKKTKKAPAKGFDIKKVDSTKSADALKKKGGKGAAATGKPSSSALFAPRPRIAGIGQDLPPKRELNRYVRWPKYIRLQRQRRILYKRLKVPPSINQFTQTLDRNTAAQLLRLGEKYAPETKAAKRERLLAAAKAKVEGGKADAPKKPYTLKYGLNHITALVEQKKASLVIIAHDVDPIELVVWLPALCRKMGVPYCIIKGKSRLGKLVGKKTATAVAFTTIAPAVCYKSRMRLCFRLSFNTLFKGPLILWL